MIIEAILTTLYIAVLGLINLLPANVVTKVVNAAIPEIVNWGACFFPMDCLFVAIGMFFTWYTIFMAWAVVEWVYKKIPGVS